jgi:hypothetical protein
VRRYVWYRNLMNEEALAHWGGGVGAVPAKKNIEIVGQ